jgi:hypothetical protein
MHDDRCIAVRRDSVLLWDDEVLFLTFVPLFLSSEYFPFSFPTSKKSICSMLYLMQRTYIKLKHAVHPLYKVRQGQLGNDKAEHAEDNHLQTEG